MRKSLNRHLEVRAGSRAGDVLMSPCCDARVGGRGNATTYYTLIVVRQADGTARVHEEEYEETGDDDGWNDMYCTDCGDELDLSEFRQVRNDS